MLIKIILSNAYIVTIASIIFHIGCQETQRENVSFGFVADVHYCDCATKGSRYFKRSIGKLESCIKTFNDSNLDFVIQAGDIIDRDFESFNRILMVFKKLKIANYHILGNSDFNIDESNTNLLFDELNLIDVYYSFSIKNWTFIILDGNDLSFHAISPQKKMKYKKVIELFEQVKAKDLPQAKYWNGGIGKKQLDWLKNELIEAEKNKNKVIIFCHFPVLPRTRHVLWNNSELVKILESYKCVKAYLNGHNHEGNYTVQNGIHYLTMKAMVETPDSSAYAIINLFDNNIEVNAFGREIDRVLSIN